MAAMATGPCVSPYAMPYLVPLAEHVPKSSDSPAALCGVEEGQMGTVGWFPWLPRPRWSVVISLDLQAGAMCPILPQPKQLNLQLTLSCPVLPQRWQGSFFPS